MYGENYGTGTLAKSLKRIAENLYFDMDDGVPWSELIDSARMLEDELYGLHCDIGRLEAENTKLRDELGKLQRLSNAR